MPDKLGTEEETGLHVEQQRAGGRRVAWVVIALQLPKRKLSKHRTRTQVRQDT